MSRRLLGSFLILATLIALYLGAGLPWTLERLWRAVQTGVQGSTNFTLEGGRLRGNLFTGVEVRDLRAWGSGQHLEVPSLRIHVDWGSLLTGPPRIDATLEAPSARIELAALDQVLTTPPPGTEASPAPAARPGRLSVIRGRVELAGGDLPLPEISIMNVNLRVRPAGKELVATGSATARALDYAANVGLEGRFDQALTSYQVTARGLPAVWAAEAGQRATFGQLQIREGRLDLQAYDGPAGRGVEATLRDIALTYVIGIPLERGGGRVNWRGGPIQAEIAGLVNGSPATIRATIDPARESFAVAGVTVTDLAAAMQLWSLPLPAAGTVRVEVAASGWERVQVDGRVTGIEATFLELPLEDLDATFQVLIPQGEPGDDKVLYQATATYLGGAVTARGEALPDWWVEIAFEDAQAGPATLTGRARVADPGSGLTIAAQSEIAGPDFWPVQGVATIAPETWPPVAEVRLGLYKGSLAATLTLDDRGPTGTWTARNLPAPGPFLATLDGGGGIAGPYDAISVTGQLASGPVEIAGFATPPLTGLVTGRFSGAERVQVEATLGVVEFAGTAHLADQRWELTGSVAELLPPEPWTGRIAGRELALTGSFAAPVLSGLATAEDLALAGVAAPPLSGQARLAVGEGPRLTFDSSELAFDLALSTWSGTLRPALTLSTPLGPLRAQGTLTGSPAEARGEITLAGPAGLATVSGRGGPPLITGRLETSYLSGGWLSGLLAISGELAEGVLDLTADGQINAPAAGASGAAMVRLTGPLDALQLAATFQAGAGRLDLTSDPGGSDLRARRFPVKPLGFPATLEAELTLAPGQTIDQAAGWAHLRGQAAGVPLELAVHGESRQLRLTGSLGNSPLSGALDLTGAAPLPTGEIHLLTPGAPSRLTLAATPGGYRGEYRGTLPDLASGPLTLLGGPAWAVWTPSQETELTAQAYGITLQARAGGRLEAAVRSQLRVLGRAVAASGQVQGEGLGAALEVSLSAPGLAGARLGGTLVRPALEIASVDLAAWTAPLLPAGLLAGEALLLASADLSAPGGPDLAFAASVTGARLSGAPVALDLIGEASAHRWWGSLRAAGNGGQLVLQRPLTGPWLRVLARQADLAWLGALLPIQGQASGSFEVGPTGPAPGELAVRFDFGGLASGQATITGQGDTLLAELGGKALAGDFHARAAWRLDEGLSPLATSLHATLAGARPAALLPGARGDLEGELNLAGAGWLPGGSATLRTRGAGYGPLSLDDRDLSLVVPSTSPLELAGEGLRVVGGEWTLTWPARLGTAPASLQANARAGRGQARLAAPGVAEASFTADPATWQATGRILAWEPLGFPAYLSGPAEFSAQGAGAETTLAATFGPGRLAGEPLELTLEASGGLTGWLWQLRGSLAGSPLAIAAEGSDPWPARITTTGSRLPAGPLAALAGLSGVSGEVSFATSFELAAGGPTDWRGWLDLQVSGGGASARGRADADGSFATATLEIALPGLTATLTGALWPEMRMAGAVSGAAGGRATLIATPHGNQLAITGAAGGKPLDLDLALDGDWRGAHLSLNWGSLAAEVTAQAADNWRPSGQVLLGDASELAPFVSGGVQASLGWTAGEWRANLAGRDLEVSGAPAALRGELTWPSTGLEGRVDLVHTQGSAELSGRFYPAPRLQALAAGLPLRWFGQTGVFDGSAELTGEALTVTGRLGDLDLGLPDVHLEYVNSPAGQYLGITAEDLEGWLAADPGAPGRLLAPRRAGLRVARSQQLPGAGEVTLDGSLSYSTGPGGDTWAGALSALLCETAGDPRSACLDATLLGREGALELSALLSESPLGAAAFEGAIGGTLGEPLLTGELTIDALGRGPARISTGGASARLESPGSGLDLEVAFASGRWTALWRGQNGTPPALDLLLPGASGALSGQISARGRLDPGQPITRLDAQVTGRLTLAALDLDFLSGTFRYETTGLTASGLRLALTGIPVSIEGRTPEGLRIAVENASLDHLGVPGTLVVGGRITGTLANPRLEAGGQVLSSLGSITAGATGSPRALTITLAGEGRGDLAGLRLVGIGNLGTAGWSGTLDLGGPHATGRFTSRLQLTGPAGAPALAGSLSYDPESLAMGRVEGTLNATLSPDPAARFTGRILDLPWIGGSSLTASARVASGELALGVAATGLFAEAAWPLSKGFDLHLPTRAALDIERELHLAGWRIGANGGLRLEHGRSTGRLELTGDLPGSPGLHLSGTIAGDGQRLAIAVRSAASPLRAEVSGHAANRLLTADPSAILEAQLNATLDLAALKLGPGSLRLVGPLAGPLNAPNGQLEARLETPGAPALAGTLTLNSAGARLLLSGAGQSLGAIATWADGLAGATWTGSAADARPLLGRALSGLEGSASGRVDARASLAEPGATLRVEGALSAQLRAADLALTLEPGSSFVYTPGRLQIPGARGELLGGRFHARGATSAGESLTIALEGLDPLGEPLAGPWSGGLGVSGSPESAILVLNLTGATGQELTARAARSPTGVVLEGEYRRAAPYLGIRATGAVTAHGLALELTGSRVLAGTTGEFTLSRDGRIGGGLRLRAAGLEAIREVLAFDADGRLSFGGNAGAPRLDADLSLAATLGGTGWPRARFTGTWTPGRFEGALQGEGFEIRAVERPGQPWSLGANLQAVRWGDLEFTGRATGLFGEGGLSGDLAIQLATPAGPAWLEGSGQGGEWRLQGRAEPAGGQVDLAATLAAGHWSGSLTATDLIPGLGLGPITLSAALDGPAAAPRLTGRWSGQTLLFPAHGELAVSSAGAEVAASIALGESELRLRLDTLWERWPVVNGEIWATASGPVRTSGQLTLSGPLTNPGLTGELRWLSPGETARLAASGRLSDLEASGFLRRGNLAAEAHLQRRPGRLQMSATLSGPAGPSRLLVELGERGGEISARLTGFELGAFLPGLDGVLDLSADLVVGDQGVRSGSAKFRASGLDLPGVPGVVDLARLRGAASGTWTASPAGWSGEVSLQTEPLAATLQASAYGTNRAIALSGALRLPARQTSFSAAISGGQWQAQAEGGGLAINLLEAPLNLTSLQVRGERLDAEGGALGGRLTVVVDGLSGLLPAALREWAGLELRPAEVRLDALGLDVTRLPGVSELDLPMAGRVDVSARLEADSNWLVSGAGSGVLVGATPLEAKFSGRVEASRGRGRLGLGDSEFDLDFRPGRLLVQGVLRGLPLDPLAQSLLGRPGVAVLATGALHADLLLDDLERSSGRLAVERLTVISTGATLTGSGGVEYAARTWTVDNLALAGAGTVRAAGRFAPTGFSMEVDAEGDVLGPVVALLIGDELRPLDRGGRLTLRASGTPAEPAGTLQASDLALVLAGSVVILRQLDASIVDRLLSARAEVAASGLLGGEASLTASAVLAAGGGLELASGQVALNGWAVVPVIGRVGSVEAAAELAGGGWRVGARMESGGTLALQGVLTPRLDLALAGRGVRLEDPDRFVQSGLADLNLHLIEEAGTLVLSGELNLAELEISIPALTSEPPADEQPVVVNLDPDPTRGGPFSGLRFDNLRITAPRNVRFQSAPLSAEFSTDLTLAGTAADPRARGEFNVLRGNISLNQYRFGVDEGRIEFTPADGLYPSFKVRASGSARLPVERPPALPPGESTQRATTLVTEPVSVRLAGSGRFVPAPEGGRRLETTFALASDPPLALDPQVAEARLLSAILFGSVEGLDLTRLPGLVVDTLFEYLLVQQLEQRLAALMGLDLFELRTDLLERIQQGDGETPGVQFTFGKYLSDQIFITYRLALGPDGTTQVVGAEFSVERALLRVSTELDFSAATLPWAISFGYLLDETTTLNLALGDRRGQTTLRFGLQFRF